MSQESQIIDLTGLSSLEIIDNIEKLLEQSNFSKFTLIIKREPKINQNLSPAFARKRLATKFSVARSLRDSTDPMKSSNKKISGQLQIAYSQGKQLYQQALYDEALDYFLNQKAILQQQLSAEDRKKSKQWIALNLHIGNCYYRLEDYQKAIQYFSLKFQNEQPKIVGQKYNNLGSCYANLDQLRLSLNSYGEALKIYSQFPEIDLSNLLSNIGTLYLRSKMYETAQKYFKQSIQQRKKKSPDNSYLIYNNYLQLGNCQKQIQKYNQAISNYRLALDGFASRGFGDQNQTLMQLASLYQLSEKWTQALDCYQKLSTKDIKKAVLYQRAALIHRNLGNFAQYNRLIKRSYQQYTNERNERKMSQLGNVVQRLSLKK